MIAGTLQAGYFGELPSTDFLTESDLIKLSGNSYYNNVYTWHKFSYKGKIVYVSKELVARTRNTFESAFGSVYGGKTIEKNGQIFQARLLRGVSEEYLPDPKVIKSSYSMQEVEKSEYNVLISFIEEDYMEKVASNQRRITFCQEKVVDNNTALLRGGESEPFAISSIASNMTRNAVGCRIAFEWIP